MCHNPDNFEPLAEVCASVRTILAVEPKLIRSDVPPEKFILLRFSGLFGMSVQNPDNFSYLAEVCVTVRTISRSGNFFASGQFSIGLTHTS